jgi:two-component sensor histidine kinase
MVMELSQDGRVTTRRSGSFGILSAEVATPLAMVLTELLQNALEHAFGPRASGTLEVGALRGRAPAAGRGRPEGRAGGAPPEECLLITVEDDGRGMPEGFDPQRGGNLGLQIVRTLATGELGGTFDMVAVPEGGTRVVLEIPIR